MNIMRNLAFGSALLGGTVLLSTPVSAQLLGGHGGLGGLGGLTGGGAFGGQGSFNHGLSGMGSGGFAAQPNFSRATNHAASSTAGTEKTANKDTGATEQHAGGLFGAPPSAGAGGGAHAGAGGADLGFGGSADSSTATNTASNAGMRGMSAAGNAIGRGETAANNGASKASDLANSTSLDAGGSAGASTNRNSEQAATAQ